MARTTSFKKGIFKYSAADGLVINGDLEVTGDIINAGFEPTEPFTFTDVLTAEAAVVFEDDLDVQGATTVVDLTASGDVDAVNLTASATVTGADLESLDDVIVGDDLSVAGKASVHGLTKVATAITATADGLTTGLITADDGLVIITSDDANKIVTLPAAAVGIVIEGYIAATGCELRTPDASGVKINNVDADGTQELAIPAGANFRAECFATTDWKVQLWNQAGAAVAAVPD